MPFDMWLESFAYEAIYTITEVLIPVLLQIVNFGVNTLHFLREKMQLDSIMFNRFVYNQVHHQTAFKWHLFT
jgi:hypothetical protein